MLSMQSMDLRTMYENGFNLLVSNPKENYRNVCRACYEWDFLKVSSGKGANNLSTVSQNILALAGTFWRVRLLYRSLCALEILYSLFCQGCLSLELFYNQFLDTFNRISEVDAPTGPELLLFGDLCKGIVASLNQLLRTYFNQDRSKGLTGKRLDEILVMISAIYTSPILHPKDQEKVDVLGHVKLLLIESLHSRYNSLLAEAKSIHPDEGYPLAVLSRSMREELQLYVDEFDVMILGKLHLPSLAANILFEPLAVQLEDFAHSYVSSSPDMPIVFELYHDIRSLQKICESIDFR
jgi:hypothetical protein